MSAKTAIIYTRVSTEGQEDNTSLDDQLRACREWAVTNGYKVTHELRELHTGAEFFERAELSFARKLIADKQVAAFIVRDIDRLSRDLGFLSYFQYECAQAECELVILADPIDDSPEGKVWASLKGYFAEAERRKIRERTMRGRRAILLSGRIHNAGTEKYGWRRDKERGVREIYEPEAAIVREIFTLTAEGVGSRSIAKKLHERGIPPPTADKKVYPGGRVPIWGKSTIRRMIGDPDYKGEAAGWRYVWDAKRKKLSARPAADHISLPAGVCPEIVSAELWQRANNTMRANRGDKTRNQARPFLLRGRIFCAVCGRRLLPQHEKALPVYRCSSRLTTLGKCDGRRVNARRAEAAVIEQVKTLLLNPDRLEAIWRAQEAAQPANPHLDRQISTIEKEIAAQNKAISRYLRLIGDAADDGLAAGYQAEFERRQRRKGDLERQILALRLERQEAGSRTDRLLSRLEVARSLALLNLSEFANQLLAVEALRIKVLASGNLIEIICE